MSTEYIIHTARECGIIATEQSSRLEIKSYVNNGKDTNAEVNMHLDGSELFKVIVQLSKVYAWNFAEDMDTEPLVHAIENET